MPENDEEVATLLSIFDSPWTAESLQAVLLQCGSLEDAIEAVLAHGDGDPDELLQLLQLKESGEESELQQDRTQAVPPADIQQDALGEVVDSKPAATVPGEVPPASGESVEGVDEPTIAELPSGEQADEGNERDRTIAELQTGTIKSLEATVPSDPVLVQQFLPVAIEEPSPEKAKEKGGVLTKVVVTGAAGDDDDAPARRKFAKLKLKSPLARRSHRPVEEPPLSDDDEEDGGPRRSPSSVEAAKNGAAAELPPEEPAPSTTPAAASAPEEGDAAPETEPTAVISDSRDDNAGAAAEEAEAVVVAQRVEPGDDSHKLWRTRRALAAVLLVSVLVIIGMAVGLTRTSKKSEGAPGATSSASLEAASEEVHAPDEPLTSAEPTTCPANESCDHPTTSREDDDGSSSFAALGGKTYGTCGFCHCIPDDALCPSFEADPQQFPWSFELIDKLSGLEALNHYELACDPFDDDEGCALDPPQSYAQLELGNSAVCGIKYVYSSPDESECPTKYRMATYDSAEEAEEDAAQLTHWGACGVCSTMKDLAAMMTYTRLEDLDIVDRAIKCSLRGEASFDDGVACYTDIGFTEDCAKIWVHSGLNAGEDCRDTCKGMISSSSSTRSPYNGPAPDCALDACLQCYSDESGQVFEAFSGRTLRRSGLLSKVVWPCDGILPVNHFLPACESQAHQPRPSPTEQGVSPESSNERTTETEDPSGRPTADPTSRPTIRPEPRPTPRPTSRPEPRPTPRPTSRPRPRPTPRPTSRPRPRPTKPKPKPREPRPTCGHIPDIGCRPGYKRHVNKQTCRVECKPEPVKKPKTHPPKKPKVDPPKKDPPPKKE